MARSPGANDATLVSSLPRRFCRRVRWFLRLILEPRLPTVSPSTSPVSLEYQTAGFLELTQILPEPGAYDVDPESAVVVAFNRPVVPLGADSAGLPAAFTLDPLPAGEGKWLNTSTYAYYPDPQLEGGKTYTVHLNEDLVSFDGSPLAKVDEPLRPANEWSFITLSRA